MAKKKKLTTLQHGGILYGRNRGESYSTITRNVKCEKTTVHDILKRAEVETTVVKKRPGRKPIFDTPALEELKKLVIQVTNYYHLSAREIQELWNKEKNQTVSISTICRALKKTGLRSCVAHYKPLISKKNKEIRYAWAKDYLNWLTHQWRNIIWSNESFFRQFMSSHNIRVWHTPAKEFDKSCLVPTVGHSPGHIFWGCFSWHGLESIISIHGRITNFFNNAGISMLPWPPQSPNLNPLENLWQEVESHLRSSLDKSTSIEDLEKKVKATWNSIPPRYYHGLVNSISNR
ncbi:27847_t:CDS:2, partial [Racocetra persica]